jgi:hypothetical protein
MLSYKVATDAIYSEHSDLSELQAHEKINAVKSILRDPSKLGSLDRKQYESELKVFN